MLRKLGFLRGLLFCNRHAHGIPDLFLSFSEYAIEDLCFM